MSGIGWRFYKEIKNKLAVNQQKAEPLVKKWNVAVAVYEEGNDSIPTKLGFRDIEAERINVCFKDKYLIISELNEVQGLDTDEDQYIFEDNRQSSFEKIIGFPRTIKKIAFSAIQNVV